MCIRDIGPGNRKTIGFYKADNVKERLEVADSGAVNRICAYEDLPKIFDAWDIEEYYKDKKWHINTVKSIEKISENCRAGLKITKAFNDSTISQCIFLYDDIKRIDFETDNTFLETDNTFKEDKNMTLREKF